MPLPPGLVKLSVSPVCSVPAEIVTLAPVKSASPEATVMPESSIVAAAMDADAAGRELCEIIREAVRLAGRHDLRFEIREPQDFKDFNDQLRQRPRVQPCRPEEPSVA